MAMIPTTSHLDSLPAQQAVAQQVLQVGGDSRSSANDLAATLQADPSLTAQVLKLANSAYYGLSGRVSAVSFAVTVVGFVSVRSVAAAFAAGALGDGADVPAGFWERAAASATACSLVAGRLGAQRPDGFSIGLLHELGDFLLYRESPETHREVHGRAAAWDCRRRCRVERELFGFDHGQVLARNLEAWMFPEEFVSAIDVHAETTRMGVPLARSIVAGQAVSALALLADEERRWSGDLVGKLTTRFEIGNVDPGQAWTLSRKAREEAELLAASFVMAA